MIACTLTLVVAGLQTSTAEVEAELMALWSAVEKERTEVTARRERHAAARETRAAPIAQVGTWLGCKSLLHRHSAAQAVWPSAPGHSLEVYDTDKCDQMPLPGSNALSQSATPQTGVLYH